MAASPDDAAMNLEYPMIRVRRNPLDAIAVADARLFLHVERDEYIHRRRGAVRGTEL